MKTSNRPQLRAAYKSLSEERGFKHSQKVKNLKRLKPTFNSRKSETIINATGLDLPPVRKISSNSQFIPSPKTPQQPKETLRRSLSKLNSSQWDEYVVALRDIVQISRFSPRLLEKSMPSIYKGIMKLLKSLRIPAARTACQAANELFMNIQYSQSVEFEELVHVLLQKAGDSNKHLRKDALEALNSMVIHMPPTQSIKTLLHRRIAGCNLNVRTTASKLLACVLDDCEAHPATSLNEEMKTRLVCAAIRFLQDDCYDIKYHGKRLLTVLQQRKDFEDIFQKKVSPDILNRVNKII